MTPQAQNIAIAKACDHEFHKPTEEELKTGSYYQYEPDFTRDLNLIQSAIMLHTEEYGWDFQQAFNHQLAEVAMRRREGNNPVQKLFWCSNATAAQRAEAFLKAKGLWATEKQVDPTFGAD